MCEFEDECDGDGVLRCECMCDRCEDHFEECGGCAKCAPDVEDAPKPRSSATMCVTEAANIYSSHAYVTALDPRYETCERCHWPNKRTDVSADAE